MSSAPDESSSSESACAPRSPRPRFEAPGGSLIILDGALAETKEQVAWYFVVECTDRDQAIELASLIPAAEHGSVEMRPVRELEP